MPRFASAASDHPTPMVGAGEALGRLIEELPRPRTVVVAVGSRWPGNLADLMEAADAVLSPEGLIGLVADAVGADGSRLLRSGMALWASDRAYPVGRMEPVGEDQSRIDLTGSGGSGGLLEPLVGYFDGNSIDRDRLAKSVGAAPAVLGELDPWVEPRFFVGQDEHRTGGVYLRATPNDGAAFAHGYRRHDDYWAVTAVAPELEVGGQRLGDRLARRGASPTDSLLGGVVLEPEGPPRFGPPEPSMSPAVGDLVALWSPDPRVGAPGLSIDFDGGASTLGFGPRTLESSSLFLPPSYLTVSTSHQLVLRGGDATISDKAYGGVGFR